MPEAQNRPATDLVVRPELEQYQTAAQLMNAIAPYIEGQINVLRTGWEGTALGEGLGPRTTKFFPDGVVTWADFDKKQYRAFKEGKTESYAINLRTYLSGFTFIFNYRCNFRPPDVNKETNQN